MPFGLSGWKLRVTADDLLSATTINAYGGAVSADGYFSVDVFRTRAGVRTHIGGMVLFDWWQKVAQAVYFGANIGSWWHAGPVDKWMTVPGTYRCGYHYYQTCTSNRGTLKKGDVIQVRYTLHMYLSAYGIAWANGRMQVENLKARLRSD